MDEETKITKKIEELEKQIQDLKEKNRIEMRSLRKMIMTNMDKGE